MKVIVGRYYRQYRRQGENLTSVKERLRSWVANVRSYGQDNVAEAYRLTNGWRNGILELFNPHSVEIDASCPQCNMRYFEQLEAGEKIRACALKANTDSVICTACGHLWDKSEFLELRKKIAENG